MTSQTMTLTVSEYVYDQLQVQARLAGQPVDQVASQVLARSVPPPPEEDLPPMLQSELEAMNLLSDDALFQIARSRMNDDKVALYDVLLDRNKDGTLTSEGSELLLGLRQEADAVMLRKAHAYSVLKSRGHRLPDLDHLVW